MKALLIAVTLLLISVMVASVQAAVYNPSDDKTCVSNGLNWSDGKYCTDYDNGAGVWTDYVGQDVSAWNDESRVIFKFTHNIPTGSTIQQATFCAVVYWGLCAQQGPYYACNIGDIYASHINVTGPGAIDVPDYNSSVYGIEKVWLPSGLGGQLITNPKYWCVDATDWVTDDVASGRTTTSIRLHISAHHSIAYVAYQNRIYSRLSPIDQPYLDVQLQEGQQPPIPPNYTCTFNCTELQDKIQSLENNVTDLIGQVQVLSSNQNEQNGRINLCENQTQNNTQRIAVLEKGISGVQTSIILFQQGLDSFKSLILGYLMYVPNDTKNNMLCGYMKDNNLTKYSTLGMTCEIKILTIPGKPPKKIPYCTCK